MCGKIEQDMIRDFLLGGRCECFILNTRTKEKVYYRIAINEQRTTYFVVIKSREDMEYEYAGYIKKMQDGSYAYSKGKKGNIGENCSVIQSLLYAIQYPRVLPDFIEVWHLGKCSRCGRKLKDTLSIQRGLGPECYKKI